ncbi:MAG TPA: hypothetical protein VF950_21730 [Planctomycetota bacterium]
MEYRGAGPFAFSYPEGWTLREEEGVVSLWKTARGGAITVSSIQGEEPADALRHCARFVEKHGLEDPRIEGDASTADATFDLDDGGWCRARVLARGPLLVLATYNTRSVNPAEEDEALAIFASLGLK